MISHSICRFYEVIKFILPLMEDIKIKHTGFDIHCSYLVIKFNSKIHAGKHIPNLK